MSWRKKALSVGAVGAALLLWSADAMADKLDDVIAAGTLRCSVTLDFPPIGYRDKDNQPVGFDVDYCRDLAAALGVEAEIVDTPWADRIPSLISGRADVSIAAASDTLERAKTVGFSIPYMKYLYQVAVREGSEIKAFDDLKGRTVGTAIGTSNEQLFLTKFNEWNDPDGEHISYQSESEMFLALSQGKVDAAVSGTTVIAALLLEGKYQGIAAGPIAPFAADVTSMMTLRSEYGFLRYLDLFINHQVRSGRYQELYEKWIGGQAPDLTTPGAYY